jgi:hypothetical protein
MRRTIALAGLIWASSGVLSAQEIFSDGFESGDVLAWSASTGVVAVDQCHLVAQTGCDLGEKCTFITTDINPLRGYAGCWEDGTVGPGGECTVNGSTMIDDCSAGGFCDRGFCEEMCTDAPESCPELHTCLRSALTFDGQVFALCHPACDLFAQDCVFDESCYLLLFWNGYPTVCQLAVPEPPPPDGCGSGLPRPGIQGECCSQFMTCDTYFGCTQPDSPDSSYSVCALNCDPTGTVGPDNCSSQLGPDYWCVAINNFYFGLEGLPDYYGFCVAESIWGPPQCWNRIQDPDEDGIDCCVEPGGNPDCPCVFACR